MNFGTTSGSAELRMEALYFSGVSNAMEDNLNSMNQQILALVEDGQSGWIGDGATAFLTRFNTEVNHYRNGIHTLRQIPPIMVTANVQVNSTSTIQLMARNMKPI